MSRTKTSGLRHMTSRSSTASPILAVLAIVLVTLGTYLGGYFWLGEYGEWFRPPAGMFEPPGEIEYHRTFNHRLPASFFGPAASLPL
jgi:hypothetical protein